MIIIYRVGTVENKPDMIECGRFDGTSITGEINVKNTTREEVLDEFNRGYYRTSEV